MHAEARADTEKKVQEMKELMEDRCDTCTMPFASYLGGCTQVVFILSLILVCEPAMYLCVSMHVRAEVYMGCWSCVLQGEFNYILKTCLLQV